MKESSSYNPMYGTVKIARRKTSLPKPTIPISKFASPPLSQRPVLTSSSSLPSVGQTHRQPSWFRPGSSPPGDSKKELLYLSLDIETDGPVPGLYSMRQIGIALFSTQGQVMWKYEANLSPLPEASIDLKTWEWWNEPEQKDAFDYMMKNPRDPEQVIKELSAYLIELKRLHKIFVVCWPACFDWSFINYYMIKFTGENPLGRTSMCGRSYAWAMAKTAHPNVDMSTLLDTWEDKRFKHTHKALDDALEQGARFVNMLRENTRNGKDQRLN